MVGPVVSNGRVQSVTFRYRRRAGEGPVLMISGFAAGGRSARELHPVPGTDLVERTWEIPDDYLGTYVFWVGDEHADPPEDFDQLLQYIHGGAGVARPDPDNPDRLVYPVDPQSPGEPFVQSVLRMPHSVPEPFLGAPLLGELTEHRVHSSTSGHERRVWVHQSVGVEPEGPPPVLMLVFDGGVYAHLMHTPEQVDALVAAGQFPPAVTLYCHYVDDASRNQELACRDDFASFVVDELLPWARAHWRFTDDPRRTVVAGSSMGGLASAWMALRHPHVFGNVIAQSPSFWWHPQHPEHRNFMATEWAERGPRDATVYVEMGDFEDSADANDFVAAAGRRGTRVVLERFCGGHDFVAWRATFARALRWLDL